MRDMDVNTEVYRKLKSDAYILGIICMEVTFTIFIARCIIVCDRH
jgi:hypothetical protein